MDKLCPEFGRHGYLRHLTRPHSAANAVACLQHDRPKRSASKDPSGRKSGRASTDDDDVRVHDGEYTEGERLSLHKNSLMPTDFRDGRTFPRRGRQPLGSFLWLARVFDKARASQAGTIYDYIYPCPMDLGMFERWGVTVQEFERAISEHGDDQALHQWAQSRIAQQACDAANSWLVTEKFENLDRQDREENVF